MILEQLDIYLEEKQLDFYLNSFTKSIAIGNKLQEAKECLRLETSKKTPLGNCKSKS